MLKIFELEKRLRDFSKSHGLVLETSYHHLGPGDYFMDYHVTNPETCDYRELRVYEYDLNNVEDVYNSSINYLREQGMVKYPVYITTVNSHNLQNSVYDKFHENPGFTQRFEIDEIRFYDSPEWRKVREQILKLSRVCKKEKEMKVKIEKVYFNAPYTIVIWSDKTKTMVKAENEAYDEEKGLAMAICKKFLGTNENKSNYFDEFKKWLPKIDGGPVNEEKEVYLTVKEFAKISGQGLTTVRKDCARGLHPGAKKVDGKWMIPYAGMARRK